MKRGSPENVQKFRICTMRIYKMCKIVIQKGLCYCNAFRKKSKHHLSFLNFLSFYFFFSGVVSLINRQIKVIRKMLPKFVTQSTDSSYLNISIWSQRKHIIFSITVLKGLAVFLMESLLNSDCFLPCLWTQKEKFHTHLAVMYLERVLSLLSESPKDEEKLTRARERLQALLRESNLYRVKFLLGEKQVWRCRSTLMVLFAFFWDGSVFV